jgi:8-oxo-dGTP diphosphatase
MKKLVEVVAAVIVNDHEILCVQRGPNKFNYISEKFEFPGGKIETGEDQVTALKRELIEELNVDFNNPFKLMTVEHEYPDFKLIMHAYVCEVPNRNIELKEHIDLVWRTSDNMDDLDWAAADLPIVQKLKNR